MRMYELFASAGKQDFVYGLARLARPQKDEFYQTLFQIYDVNNQKAFGVDELVTIVNNHVLTFSYLFLF